MKSNNTPTAEVLKVFETVPNMYLILSPDLRILTASDLYLEATQTVREKLVGRHIFEAFPDNPATPDADGVKNIHASLQRVLATRKPDQMPVQHYDVPDPARPGAFVERYWLPSHTPVLDGQGEISYIIQLAINITGTIRANHQLKASQDREIAALAEVERQRRQLQSIIEQAPVALAFLKGEDHRVESANPLMCRMWGRRQADVLGRLLGEVLPEARGRGFGEEIATVFRTGIPIEGKEAITQLERGGLLKTVYYNFAYQPLYNGQRAVTGVLVAATDVTEQVLARKQVEQSEQVLQALNQELAAANEELMAVNEDLTAVNEELTASGEELLRAKGALQQSNNQLEERVRERTRALQDAQGEAERERNRLRQVFMQASVPICILNGDQFIYELVNAAYQRLLPGRKLLGLSMLEGALPELASQPFANILRQVYRTGETFERTEELISVASHQGGPLEERYFNYTVQALRNEQGQHEGILVFALDVTGQVLARKKVEESEGQVRSLVESAPFSIAVYTGQEMRIQFANPAMLQGWGKGQDVVGKRFEEVLPEFENQQVFEQLNTVFTTGVAFHAYNQALEVVVDQKRQTFYYNYSFIPLLNAQGKVYGVMNTAANVTDLALARKESLDSEQQAQLLAGELAGTNTKLKTSNQELSSANEQLRRTNVDLDTFVYTASHDLKAPILNIEGLLKALEKQLGPEVLQKDAVGQTCQLLSSQVNRFKTTIEDLTEVARIGKESIEDLAAISIEDTLAEVLKDLAPQIEEAGARLTVALDCLPVLFSRKNLKSVLYNLLSNAIKYRSPEREPRIRITCHAQGEYQVLSVEDNGLGIPSQQQHKLFKLFKRLHNHVEGTGIGLYIVKRMIENAGGNIEVESRVGVGSTFKVYFRQ